MDQEKNTIKNQFSELASDFREYLKGIRVRHVVLICFFFVMAYYVRLMSGFFRLDDHEYLVNIQQMLNTMIASGRFGLAATGRLFSITVNNPFLLSVLFAFTMVIGQGILVPFLFYRNGLRSFRSGTLCVLFFALFAVHPCFAEQYNFFSQCFEVAFGIVILFAGALFLLEWSIRDRSVLFGVIGMILLAYAFASYQSNVFLLIAILITLYLFLSEEQTISTKQLVRTIAVPVIAGVIYYLFSKLLQAVTGNTNGYVGSLIFWGQRSAGECLDGISEFVKMVARGRTICYSKAYFVLGAVTLLIMILTFVKQRKFCFRKLLFYILLMCSPFYLPLLAGAYQAVRADFVTPFVQAALLLYSLYLLKKISEHNLQCIYKLAAGLLIVFGLYAGYLEARDTSLLYYTSETAYQRDCALLEEILDDATETTGLDLRNGETKVLFSGAYSVEMPENTVSDAELPVGSVMCIRFFDYSEFDAPNRTTVLSRLAETLGYRIQSGEAVDADACAETLKTMPSYPEDGYIQVMNGVVCIKLSD